MADECPAVVQGLKEALASLPEVVVVGGATGSEETLSLAEELLPDLIVLDPSFQAEAPVPLRDGEVPELDLVRELKSLPGPPVVVFYSSFNTTADLMALVLAGADGYIHKATPLEQLTDDVKDAAAGDHPWRLGLEPAEAKRRLLAASRVWRLSPAEKKVLSLVLRGGKDEQIAEVLHLSSHTVKNHVRSLLRKLEYRYRREIFED